MTNTNPSTDWSQLNPQTLWRDWVVKSEQQWSEVLSTLMKDERAGGTLNTQVAQARMLQKQLGEMMHISLASSNLPSRSDIEAVEERLGRVEDGLAALAAQISQLTQALLAREVVQAAAAGIKQPTRSRKPALAAKK
jgi:acyl carrier protein phosphodiesterase